MELKGKCAIVTGGAMGIGFATANLLLQEGCNVTIWDINEATLTKSRDALRHPGVNVFARLCDVTDKSQVYESAKQAIMDMGRIDILVNNAGFVKGGEFLAQPDEVWEKTIDVNLTALIYTIRAVLPGMYERNTGHIINISSAAGLLGVADLSVYAATKWAVLGLTESLRFESWNGGYRGVKWSSIHPSYLAHGMFEGAKLGFLGNLIVPLVKNHDVIARAIVYQALKKGKNVVRRPKSLKLALILRGLLPDFLFQRMLIIMGVHRSMESWKGRG